MKNATADVPVSLADFHAVDHLYSVTVPVLAPGERPLPSVLHPGQAPHLPAPRLQLVGEGTMQWAPITGTRPRSGTTPSRTTDRQKTLRGSPLGFAGVSQGDRVLASMGAALVAAAGGAADTVTAGA